MDIIKFVGSLLNPKEKEKVMMSLDDIADFLGENKEAIEKFEAEYHKADFSKGLSDNYFEVNAKQAVALKEHLLDDRYQDDDIVDQVVKEFVAQTVVYSYENKKQKLIDYTGIPVNYLTPEDLKEIPELLKPQCLGRYYQRDIPDSSKVLLDELKEAVNNTDPKKRRDYYNLFRQGMDILDLDEILYRMIDQNPNSMGNWLPKIAGAIDKQGFFKIPDTKIIKVPIAMLQLMRQFQYPELSPSTIRIINKYCHTVFELKNDKKYFIKTGIRCSKQDFRNALVQGEKEIKELGEYLFYIHQQGLMMASPLNKPCIYGAGTTVEWVVRDFIEDKEDNLTIYHGMPLHTEYRVFVDFDTKEVLGIHNYWDSDVMLKHFTERYEKDPSDIDAKHDYVTYKANFKNLKKRYNENKDKISEKVQEFIKDCDMKGQWSLDIMQNGDDFWFIDAALAEQSAFFKEAVPDELKKINSEEARTWIPRLS